MTAFSSPLPIDLLADFSPESIPEIPLECRLIGEAREGNHSAFRGLVEMHQARVHRLCLQWLQCEDDAAEVCQDTFLRAWQALPLWQPRARLTTWLCRIALNLCRDRARSRARRQGRVTIPLANLAVLPVCSQATPDAVAAHSGDIEKLQRGLSVLPPPMREVLILCGIEDMS
jgi:RNA polymerase sigma factor (sigma-70 family)